MDTDPGCDVAAFRLRILFQESLFCVLNILHRLIDEKATDGPTIDAPQALRPCRRHASSVTPGAQSRC